MLEQPYKPNEANMYREHSMQQRQSEHSSQVCIKHFGGYTIWLATKT